ncbi:plasmid mobilization relaxosome protein MobC, partial [Limosilactobacillus reuteri]|uniref:plasmid mobilization relaxosome protein MobC n=1 Tax=Limosilactobacillus reuteri TaxID=1598 RepID=UPI0012E2F18A
WVFLSTKMFNLNFTICHNINQIAHYVNKYPDNDLGKELVNAFNIVSKRIDELRSDINEHC